MQALHQSCLSRAAAAVLTACAAAGAQAQTLTTAFTYQGQLATAGTPATGTYDIRYRLYDAASGGTQVGSTLCSDDLAVVDGRFAALLDFGTAFAGQRRFLEIEVRPDAGLDCSNADGYTILTPRQELTAAPNAMFAQNANTATTAANATSLNGQSPSFYQNAANLTGTLADARLSGNVARLDSNQTFTGQLNFTNAGNTFAGSGAGLTNLNGSSINSGTLARAALSTDVQSGLGALVPELSPAGSIATDLNPYGVAVSGSFAYVANASSDTLQIFNISNPAAPTLAASIAAGNQPMAVAVSGSFAYVANHASSTLQIFNISNPSAPVLAGSIVTGSGPISVAVSGSFAYVVNRFGNTMQIFNVSNPAAPTMAAFQQTGLNPYAITVSGSFAYVVSHASDVLQIFNISNPASPWLASSIAVGSNPASVAVSGSFAYVVIASNVLKVFNIANPAAPTLVGSVATGNGPSSVSVSGSFAHVVNSTSNTLQVFNISNAAAPALAGSIATAAGPLSVAASGAVAYVVGGTNMLQVFRTFGVGFGTPLASSSLTGVNGSGLRGVNAASLNGQDASFYTNASNITTGTLSNARTTGTNLNTPSTLVARDGAGNFAGSTITATSFVGSGAALTGLNASALSSGSIPSARLPGGGAWALTSNLNIDSNTLVVDQLNARVGIGTATPAYTLDVAGSAQLTGSGRLQFNGRGHIQTNEILYLNPFTGGGNVIVGGGGGAGNMQVIGSLAKGGGSFKIDHPLDPENKYLYHSFVESPDMMNVYNGTVTTDSAGYATITMPDYFEALNRDFRYQLTIVDDGEALTDFILTRVVSKMKGNQFTIKTSQGNVEVSWQVTGIRHDAWANKNRIPNSVDKPAGEKGKLLHPEAFNQPVEKSVHFAVPAAASNQ